MSCIDYVSGDILLSNRVFLIAVRRSLHIPMSAEASVGSHAADSADSAIAPPSCYNTDEQRYPSLLGSKYVKLNVGGTLHYTTVQTLSKEDSLLRRICNGETEATIDPEGEWRVNTSLNVSTACCVLPWPTCMHISKHFFRKGLQITKKALALF